MKTGNAFESTADLDTALESESSHPPAKQRSKKSLPKGAFDSVHTLYGQLSALSHQREDLSAFIRMSSQANTICSDARNIALAYAQQTAFAETVANFTKANSRFNRHLTAVDHMANSFKLAGNSVYGQVQKLSEAQTKIYDYSRLCNAVALPANVQSAVLTGVKISSLPIFNFLQRQENAYRLLQQSLLRSVNGHAMQVARVDLQSKANWIPLSSGFSMLQPEIARAMESALSLNAKHASWAEALVKTMRRDAIRLPLLRNPIEKSFAWSALAHQALWIKTMSELDGTTFALAKQIESAAPGVSAPASPGSAQVEISSLFISFSDLHELIGKGLSDLKDYVDRIERLTKESVETISRSIITVLTNVREQLEGLFASHRKFVDLPSSIFQTASPASAAILHELWQFPAKTRSLARVLDSLYSDLIE